MQKYYRSDTVLELFERTKKNGLAVSGLVISLSTVSLYKILGSQYLLTQGLFFGAIVAALIQQLLNYLSDDYHARSRELEEVVIFSAKMTEEECRSIMGEALP